MKAAVRQRWLARLRSGQDAQCRLYLHPRPGVFDVLGLLVDLFIQEQGLSWQRSKHKVFTFGQIESVLPPEVRRWAGLTGVEAMQLVHLNDVDGLTFPQLADYIESNITGELDYEQPGSTSRTSPAMGQPAPSGPARFESME